MNASRPRTGGRFGPYELRSMLGRGSMGEVYEAYDTHNDRVVALKLLPEELAQDPSYRERFRRESHAATRIADPHIVPINRAGEIEGMLYLDMRLIRGDNLRALLRRQGAMEPARAVHIVEQIATALDAAHGAGLVHRDVKPANILVTPTDFAFLTDFGIARSEGDSSTTMVGITAGSYTYMAPERFDSGPVTGRSDIYSLACVLYECLTGATPFPVQNVSTLIRAHLSETPPRPSLQRSDVPAALDAVLAHAMSKSPEDRFASAGEFAGAARAAVGLSGGSETAVAAPPPPPTPTSVDPPRPQDTGAVQAGPLPPLPQRAAPGPGAARPVLEPTTFQPFGPDGPTIAAQFQPRGDELSESGPEPREEIPPATGSATTVMRTGAGTGIPSNADETTNALARGPVPTSADQDIPDEPAPAPRGYETTGSLRIIAPADPEERDTSSDLPVITPTDPSRMSREEFEFAPKSPQPPGLPQRAVDSTPPAPKLPQRTSQAAQSEPTLPQRGPESTRSTPQLPQREPQPIPPASQLPQRSPQPVPPPEPTPPTSVLPQRAPQPIPPPQPVPPTSVLPQRAAQSAQATQHLPQRAPESTDQALNLPPQASEPTSPAPKLPPRAPESDPAPHTELLPHGTTAGAAAAGVIGAGYAEYEDESQYGSHDGYDDQAGYRTDDGYQDEYGDYDSEATHTGQGYADYSEDEYAENGYGRDEYDHGTYAEGEYAEGEYAESDYVSGEYDQDEYGRGEYDDRTPHSVLGYGPDDNGDYSDDYEYADTPAGYGERGTTPKKRSVAVPLVLGFLGAAVAIGVGVVGWQVLGKSPTSSSSAAQQTAAVAATTAPMAAPQTEAADTTTTAATSTPPEGSTACSSSSSGQDTKYTRAASGNSQTTCGFAEAVRKAYAKEADAESDSPTSVVAVSPTTGRSYTMTCKATGRLITCSGGDNAVVYVY